MPRDSETQYEQDRLGNEKAKLDELRAQEGNSGLGTSDGIVNIGSADTGVYKTAYSIPTHASRVIAVQVWGFNSVGSGNNTFTLGEATLNGTGSIVSTTQRSVPIAVGSGSTRVETYKGLPFTKAIAVSSEFQGQVGVAVISDHDREDDTAVEVTQTP